MSENSKILAMCCWLWSPIFMGKKSGSSSSSWLTAVKRAFRSPTKKEHNNNNNINAHGNEAEEDDDKVRLKYWVLFLHCLSPNLDEILTLIQMLCFFFAEEREATVVIQKNNESRLSGKDHRRCKRRVCSETCWNGGDQHKCFILCFRTEKRRTPTAHHRLRRIGTSSGDGGATKYTKPELLCERNPCSYYHPNLFQRLSGEQVFY